MLAGYSWIGGANSAAFVPVGEGWITALGTSYGTLLLVAVIFGLVLLTGLGGYASIVFGTLARGRAIPQEVLVSRDMGHE
jgi:hypothetical protein